MKDKIHILNTTLLEDKSKLSEIDRWLNVFNWPNGWHYDLDIIWALKSIEELNLPVGATIIDAGGGIGMTQFILASRGFNVISLDFTQRKIPRFATGIFNIENIETDLGNFKHEYMSFMSHGQSTVKTEPESVKTNYLEKMKKVFNPELLGRHIYYRMYRLTNFMMEHFNVFYMSEKMKDHSKYGKITFLRGTFNSIPLKDNTADAMVSISAFEHNTYKDMPGSIEEFKRVLKPGAPMFITTSASDKEDWYFEPPKAWVFSAKTLASWFGVAQEDVSFDYEKEFRNMSGSAVLKQRMSPFYKLNNENSLPFGNLNEAKFLPVGIAKYKE